MPERKPSKLCQRLIPILANPAGLAVDRFLMRWFNVSFMGPMFTRAGGYATRPHLILRTVHWKTGALKDVVLPYSSVDGNYIVVGSHGGRPTDAIWSLNLRSCEHCWVCVDRQWHYCRGSVTQGVLRERYFDVVNADGGYRGYTKMASRYRQLPVVELNPNVERQRPMEDPMPQLTS